MGIIERYRARVARRLSEHAIVENYKRRRQMRLDYNDSQPREENGRFAEVPDSQKAENKEKHEAKESKGSNKGGGTVRESGSNYTPKKGSVSVHPKQEGMTITPRGANPSCGAFDDKYREAEHYRLHEPEDIFKGMSREQYVKTVEEFLRQPTSRDVHGYTYTETIQEGGKEYKATGVVRFDTKTGFFAKGVPGVYIKTGFQAKMWNDEYNPKSGRNPHQLEDAQDYYKKQLIKDKGVWK